MNRKIILFIFHHPYSFQVKHDMYFQAAHEIEQQYLMTISLSSIQNQSLIFHQTFQVVLQKHRKTKFLRGS